jgi:hypothetical protein
VEDKVRNGKDGGVETLRSPTLLFLYRARYGVGLDDSPSAPT